MRLTRCFKSFKERLAPEWKRDLNTLHYTDGGQVSGSMSIDSFIENAIANDKALLKRLLTLKGMTDVEHKGLLVHYLYAGMQRVSSLSFLAMVSELGADIESKTQKQVQDHVTEVLACVDAVFGKKKKKPVPKKKPTKLRPKSFKDLIRE